MTFHTARSGCFPPGYPYFAQGCADYWQQQFIYHNFLAIGHTAWSGYLHTGRGLVVCQVTDQITPDLDWCVTHVS
jgi:hypothetical protein